MKHTCLGGRARITLSAVADTRSTDVIGKMQSRDVSHEPLPCIVFVCVHLSSTVVLPVRASITAQNPLDEPPHCRFLIGTPHIETGALSAPL